MYRPRVQPSDGLASLARVICPPAFFSRWPPPPLPNPSCLSFCDVLGRHRERRPDKPARNKTLARNRRACASRSSPLFGRQQDPCRLRPISLQGIIAVGGPRRSERERERENKNAPVRVVDLGVVAHQLLLARLVGQIPAHLVAVLLGLQKRDEVDAGPDLLAAQLAVGEKGDMSAHVRPVVLPPPRAFLASVSGRGQVTRASTSTGSPRAEEPTLLPAFP
jgi:hypothetical protein